MCTCACVYVNCIPMSEVTVLVSKLKGQKVYKYHISILLNSLAETVYSKDEQRA